MVLGFFKVSLLMWIISTSHFCFMFWALGHRTCGILAPPAGMELEMHPLRWKRTESQPLNRQEHPIEF